MADDIPVVELRFLGTQVRSLQRQLAMLQAGQAQLPTLDQFQAGLSAIDEQFVLLADMIAQKVSDALSEHLTEISDRLGKLEGKR